MKAALNGAVNCSVLDGWWDECYDGDNGWAIGTLEVYVDADVQDRIEASALYDLLERDIVPRFYERPEGPVPRRWVERMKASVSSLGHFVTADRMVRDYVIELYEPAAAQAAAMASDHFAGRNIWPSGRSASGRRGRTYALDVEGDVTAADVGEVRQVSATIRLGRLGTEDIAVQLAHGRVGANGELIDPGLLEMQPEHCDNGTCSYRGSFTSESPGLYGFSVRAVPSHDDLTNEMDLGLVVWA